MITLFWVLLAVYFAFNFFFAGVIFTATKIDSELSYEINSNDTSERVVLTVLTMIFGGIFILISLLQDFINYLKKK